LVDDTDTLVINCAQDWPNVFYSRDCQNPILKAIKREHSDVIEPSGKANYLNIRAC